MLLPFRIAFLDDGGIETVEYSYHSYLNTVPCASIDPKITYEKIIDTELKQFPNVNQVFICKIPARFDFQSINSKVIQFNKLLFERFSDTEEHLNVIETIPSEFRFYHHDGLHMSNFGLTKLSGIIMSRMYET